MSSRSGLRPIALSTLLAAGTVGACRASGPAAMPKVSPTATVPAEPLAEPAAAASSPARGDSAAAPEQIVTLTGDWDVRLALEEIAKTARYSLIVSPRVPPRKVRLSIVNAPASQALAAVLDAAQLTLEPARGPQPPWNPSVVFYQVPVNVDSLSADAIMKRFGVSRDIANLILAGRRPE